MTTTLTDRAPFLAMTEYDDHVRVVKIEEPAIGLLGFIAIHRKRGNHPSLGATRLWTYTSEQDALRDALRLARLMSYKSAGVDLPYGGAKAVLMSSPLALANREAIFTLYAKAVNDLGGTFVTGTDLGVTDKDLEIMAVNTPYVIGRGVNAGYFTALGIFYAMQVCLEHVYGDGTIAGRSFAIQGLGKTGFQIVELLVKHGATNITVTDIDPLQLAKAKAEYPFLKMVSPEQIYSEPVDLFSPCAAFHALNTKTVPFLRCRAVAGSANNQLESLEIVHQLDRRGILYAPDYLVNSGGLLSVVDQYQHVTHNSDRIIKKLQNMQQKLRGLFSRSRIEKIPAYVLSNTAVGEVISRV